MSCKDCECSSHCIDAYTAVSHLCNNYHKESKEKRIPAEFIKALIDIRYECGIAECEECPYADEYNNCYFTGLPYEWYNLEELLKKESEE